MIFILSISTDHDPEKKGQYYKAYALHNLLMRMDNKIVTSSTKLYDLLRCLREDIIQLDHYYNCETVLNVSWEKDKNQHVIAISTRFYSATLTAKQISRI